MIRPKIGFDVSVLKSIDQILPFNICFQKTSALERIIMVIIYSNRKSKQRERKFTRINNEVLSPIRDSPHVLSSCVQVMITRWSL